MKRIILLVGFICGLAFSASAQNCNDAYLGTKTLYKALAYKYTPVPTGYKPVFINHVGRHGARHLTKDVNTTLAYHLLQQADSASALSAQGKKLWQMVIALQKIEKGSVKFISAEGKNELKGIGERMYANYSNVFKGKPNLDIAVTKEIRTKQSADAFLEGLEGKMTDSTAVSFYNDDTDLRFYDLSPAYKDFEGEVAKGTFKSALKKAENYTALNHAIAARFFTGDFLNRLDESTKEKFTDDIFGFLTIVYSLKYEVAQNGYTPADVDFNQFFTCAELQKLGKLDDADNYLTKGPGTNNDGIQVRIAAPLLADFIKTSDDYIKTGKYNARLRFAHAETIAPFAAILQIAAADKTTTNILDFDQKWQTSKIIELSSNIQWIFYKRKDRPGYLVKVLLNEKEAYIDGLNKSSFPYYKWSELRALYVNKLNMLHLGLDDDMGAYLGNVK
jgi:multiple inositol-polyphosphate phosphatase/2,3-bisphosphoglycerate 3-phosphatase